MEWVNIINHIATALIGAGGSYFWLIKKQRLQNRGAAFTALQKAYTALSDTLEELEDSEEFGDYDEFLCDCAGRIKKASRRISWVQTHYGMFIPVRVDQQLFKVRIKSASLQELLNDKLLANQNSYELDCSKEEKALTADILKIIKECISKLHKEIERHT